MKKTKSFAKFMTIVLAVSTLAGCGGTKDVDNGKVLSFPEKLTAEKIGTIDMKDKSLNVSDGGIYYRAGDKYGVMTFDGKKDTGAVYNYCLPKKSFFMINKELPASQEMTAENLNIFGLVDATGKTIVPDEYATIDILNDRFIKVCKVSEKTDTKDDALVFYTERSIALFANDDDTFFKGTWYIYDAETGEQVEGVSGTNAYNVTARGNYIEYVTDDKEEKCVNYKGEALPEGAKLLNDGSYVIENVTPCSAYDTEGNKLFDYQADDYNIAYCNEGSPYYVAKKTVDNTTKYMLLNKKGEVVSTEFANNPSIFGECVYVDKKLYDFEGNVICEGEFKSPTIDKFTQSAIIATLESGDTVLIKDGKDVIAEFPKSDNIDVSSADFLFSKKINDKNTYYSIKDKEYNIEGSSYGSWLVETRNEDNTANLVDTISGEIILNGHSDYERGLRVGTTFYAFGKNEDGTYDVYLIK